MRVEYIQAAPQWSIGLRGGSDRGAIPSYQYTSEQHENTRTPASSFQGNITTVTRRQILLLTQLFGLHGIRLLFLEPKMDAHMQRVGNVGAGFLGEDGVLRQVIVPLLLEDERIELTFFAHCGMALDFPPNLTSGYFNHGHVILTNLRFIWMFEQRDRHQTRAVKTYPWHVVQSWGFLSWRDDSTENRRGFSLHVDMQAGEVDRTVLQRKNVLQRENLFVLENSVDATGFALISRSISAKILQQRKVDDSVSS